jgi:hypothetical protein
MRSARALEACLLLELRRRRAWREAVGRIGRLLLTRWAMELRRLVRRLLTRWLLLLLLSWAS